MFSNKTILITGGTGTFGKAFIKTLLSLNSHGPKKIIVYSRDEYKQFEMSQEDIFRKSDRIRYFVGDVRDRDRLYRAFDNVNFVIHAAALKQIPSCEYNPFEAIKTNVYGAQNVIDASVDRGVSRVVALSSDKACSPINLYGATKLCSDKLFIAAGAYSGNHKTKFSVVRYGNVAGSRGSIIPFFQSLIDSGAREIPITDKRMTRFWLTIDQAVHLVIYALHNMTGGELYVPKIPSFKIVDLAKAMAPKIKLKEIGIRPGEKISEMMISKDDARNTYDAKDFYIIYPDVGESDRKKGLIKRKGTKMKLPFEYESLTNTKWLTENDIRKILIKIA